MAIAAGRSMGSGELLWGHPKGLFYLAFTEAWERFSYYGMAALLVLYMVNQLLLPGHVEHVAGFEAFRGALESVRGPMSTQALASQIFGLYTGFVYFTPLVGGLIADRWIGQRNAVIIGALAMAGGHLAMAFDRSFLLALVLLVVGSGFLKGNISAQVGALYPLSDETRRTRGFAIFSTGINFGAVVGPLLCGLLAQLYGWHVGFGAAAMFMLGGLATYLAGYRHLPARVPRRTRAEMASAAPLTRAERRVLLALGAVMLITIFQSVAYYQLANVFAVWLEQSVALEAGVFHVPAPWFQSIDPLFSILAVPLLFWLWRLQGRRGREPGDLAKIGTGAWVCMASNLLLVFAIVEAGGEPIHPLWPFLYCAGQGIAFIYYWPTLLALVSRTAPAQVNATVMGVAFMTLFVGNNLIGWIGGFYESMGALAFWSLHAAIAAAGGLLVRAFGATLGRVLEAGGAEQPLRASALTLEVER
ncbi:MAG TPA: peptide MFS transporter [Steroidobacteraceae bacterium]|nr:peptide MFS transporter [Steroidobacteraceae bacterium]